MLPGLTAACNLNRTCSDMKALGHSPGLRAGKPVRNVPVVFGKCALLPVQAFGNPTASAIADTKLPLGVLSDPNEAPKTFLTPSLAGRSTAAIGYGPNFESSSRLIKPSDEVSREMKETPLAYLLDFESDSPANSSNAYGFRVIGKLWTDEDDAEDVFVRSEAMVPSRPMPVTMPLTAEHFSSHWRLVS